MLFNIPISRWPKYFLAMCLKVFGVSSPWLVYRILKRRYPGIPGHFIGFFSEFRSAMLTALPAADIHDLPPITILQIPSGTRFVISQPRLRYRQLTFDFISNRRYTCSNTPMHLGLRINFIEFLKFQPLTMSGT